MSNQYVERIPIPMCDYKSIYHIIDYLLFEKNNYLIKICNLLSYELYFHTKFYEDKIYNVDECLLLNEIKTHLQSIQYDEWSKLQWNRQLNRLSSEEKKRFKKLSKDIKLTVDSTALTTFIGIEKEYIQQRLNVNVVDPGEDDGITWYETTPSFTGYPSDTNNRIDFYKYNLGDYNDYDKQFLYLQCFSPKWYSPSPGYDHAYISSSSSFTYMEKTHQVLFTANDNSWIVGFNNIFKNIPEGSRLQTLRIKIPKEVVFNDNTYNLDTWYNKYLQINYITILNSIQLQTINSQWTDMGDLYV